jgi:hypothetical protein
MVLQFKHLIHALNIYLIGNSNTQKIIKPGELTYADIHNCEVVEISAMGNSPVIWIDYKPEV